MKQYLNSEQTAKLIELGLPKPKSMNGEYNGWQFMPTPAYSIGELIEMLPRTIKSYYDLCILSTTQGWWILYGIIGDGDMWSVEYEVHSNELIYALYEMAIKLKEEGVI